MVLDSLNPYEFVSRNLNYDFITERGDQYFAYFTQTGYFEEHKKIEEDIVSFGFALRNAEPKVFFVPNNGTEKRECILDTRIRDTVVCILQEFMFSFPIVIEKARILPTKVRASKF